MYNSGFGTGFNYGNTTGVLDQLNNTGTGATVWTLVSLILALIGCFVVYFLFVVKKDHPKQKFLAWLKDFLSFKKMLIEVILKIAYLFCAIFITLSSFALIGTSFLAFLLTLILGNLFTRLAFEGILMMIMIWKNTTEINKKLK